MRQAQLLQHILLIVECFFLPYPPSLAPDFNLKMSKELEPSNNLIEDRPEEEEDEEDEEEDDDYDPDKDDEAGGRW